MTILAFWKARIFEAKFPAPLYCCNLSIGVVSNLQFTTNRMCMKNNTHIYVAQTRNNREIAVHDLYCYLLPQCEALCTWRSGFLIATKWCCDQDVMVMPGADFTKRMCDWCSLLYKWGIVVATSPLALCQICDSPPTGCAWRITPIYMWHEQAIIEWLRHIISMLLAATVWSFVHMPLGLSNRNSIKFIQIS